MAPQASYKPDIRLVFLTMIDIVGYGQARRSTQWNVNVSNCVVSFLSHQHQQLTSNIKLMEFLAGLWRARQST
ncbi:hypothetical protein KIN20_036128 [Parelaphostrongylus tenuis]|uniref:Uncharacterized protein n=1 Tax=Parelaphostrongylus tenuis TaxID=148309 RepID=A0AAD5RCE5_PARTN|nr:hypothetical protein KIN20_036128 [Parelaphostrongylus tenuis]